MISSISMTEFLKIMDHVSIIDIRMIESFNNNHIPGATNVPLEKLLIEPSKYMELGKTYYIYCQKGISTPKISQILNRMGYQTIHLLGGYEAWVMER